MNEPVATPISVEALSEAVASTPQSDVSEMMMDDSTMNHLSYKATNKVPYVVNYLGLSEFFNTNPEITAMARELHMLLVDNDSEVQVHQTKSEMDALAQELNLQDNDAPVYKLRKMLEMAKIKARLAQKERFNLQVLADSTRM